MKYSIVKINHNTLEHSTILESDNVEEIARKMYSFYNKDYYSNRDCPVELWYNAEVNEISISSDLYKDHEEISVINNIY